MGSDLPGVSGGDESGDDGTASRAVIAIQREG